MSELTRCLCGDSGTTHYGKTLREALASAMAEGA